jgi:hypothetical protein
MKTYVHRILFKMRSVSEITWRDSQNTHFMFNNFFLPENGFFKIVRENIVQPDRPQMAVSYGACALLTG